MPVQFVPAVVGSASAAAVAVPPAVPPRHSLGKEEEEDLAGVVLADRLVTQDPVKIRNPFSSHTLEKEYAALDHMRDIAAGDGVSLDDGKKFFDLQYGKTDVARLAHFKAEFGGRYPTNVESDTLIVKRFVTPKFIELFKKFVATPGMTRLRLNDEKTLYRIPANISSCQKLHRVNFATCALQSLPDTLFSCPALQDINLRGNLFMGDFNRDWSAMPKLKMLNLSYCNLDSFDGKFKSAHLLKIDVQFNGLSALPSYTNNKIPVSCLDKEHLLAWWNGNQTLLSSLLKTS